VGILRHDFRGDYRTVNQAAGAMDRIKDRIFHAEVLEQGNDIGKRPMECRCIYAVRFSKVPPQAVDNGVSRLMGDNIVRKACEDCLSGKTLAGVLG
jgi:hypothetical protein